MNIVNVNFVMPAVLVPVDLLNWTITQIKGDDEEKTLYKGSFEKVAVVMNAIFFAGGYYATQGYPGYLFSNLGEEAIEVRWEALDGK